MRYSPRGAGVTIAALSLLVATACRHSNHAAGGAAASTTSTSATSTSTTSTSTTTTTTLAPPAIAPTCPPTPARAAPSPTRPRYQLRLDVRPAEALVVGDLSVHFTPDRDTDRLVFRLWPNGPRVGSGGGRLDTGPVTVDGRPVGAALESPTLLSVPLGRTLQAGTAVDASMAWQLRLPGAINDRVARIGDTVRLGSFFPILAWEPGVGWALDPPTSEFAEASTSPTADFAMTVTTPPGFDVLASGVPDGRGGWTATAMRDVALSVGHFALASGVAHAPGPVQVVVGVDASLSLSPQPFLAKAIRVLESYAPRFGPYPWPTYSLAVTPALNGGIEYPSHVMQGPTTIGRTTSHEIGHQWFYGLVGDDQARDPWLDEALATWAEWGYEGTLASNRARAIPVEARGHVGEPMTFWEPRQSIYSLGVYIQGAQALASLGPPELVDCGLRLYAAVNAYRIARPVDLVRAMGAAFPGAAAALAPYGIRP